MDKQVKAPSNAFLRTLAELRKGQTASELSDELSTLVAAVRATGKGGEITLKIKVKMNGDAETVSVKDSFSVKVPKMDTKETNFFMSEDNVLLRHDPRQKDLPFKAVDGGAAEEESETAQAVND